MCEWGNSARVTVPAHYRGGELIKKKVVLIDECLAGLVSVLNRSRLYTIASCCGHGKRPGRISFENGREFFVVGDYETAQKIDKIFDKEFRKINV